MSSSEHVPHIDKGKSRACHTAASERTPLLASQSRTPDDDRDLEPTSRSDRRLWSKLIFIFLATLSICESDLCCCVTMLMIPLGIVAFIVVALLAYSYAARVMFVSSEELLDRAVTVKGPDRLDVLNITEGGGIWIKVEGRVGVDAGAVIGVNSEDGDGIFRDIWKSIGRWGIQRLDRITIKLTTIQISSEGKHSAVLGSLDTASMDVALTTEPPSDFSWLSKVSMPVFVAPTQNASALLRFVRDSWRDGTVVIQAHVERAIIQGGSLSDNSWRRLFNGKLSEITTAIRMKSEYWC